jgi:carboxylesterase
MRYLAKGLAARGWDVYVTTLPGHCTQVRDLVNTNEQQWQEHVVAQLACARQSYEVIFVAGLSAGALLALDAATVVDVNGVGVMSPSFVYDGWNRPWSYTLLPFAMKRVSVSWQHLLFHVADPPFGVKDDALQIRLRAAYSPMMILRDWFRERQTSEKTAHGTGGPKASATPRCYPVFPLKTLTELDRLSTRVRARLSGIRAPVVTLQAVDDDRTSSRNAFIVHDEIGSVEKRLVLLKDSFHVITIDKQRREVVHHLDEFFEAQVQSFVRPSLEHSSRSSEVVVGTGIRWNAGPAQTIVRKQLIQPTPCPTLSQRGAVGEQ